MIPISRGDLIEILRDGVRRTADFIASLTDYHGGPVEIEYLLTSDIARAFLIGERYEVRVEYLYRYLIHPLNCLNQFRPTLGATRTDIAVVDSVFPVAIIEIKIRVTTFAAVSRDINRIYTVMNAMIPEFATACFGAVVYEVHLRTASGRKEIEHLKKRLSAIEERIHRKLRAYAEDKSGFHFEIVPLQAETEGIVDWGDADGPEGPEITHDPHITKYYAIIISRTTASVASE